MRQTVKRMNEKYIEVGYDDKVVFIPKKKARGSLDVIATWKRSQGLWKEHPVFQNMTVKDIIEWLRGKDCDI